MKIGLVIYGSLETVSGGYLYDRKLVEYLRGQGDDVQVLSISWRNYAAHLADNWNVDLLQRLREFGGDVLLQDELNHPSLFLLNRRLRGPIVAIVHHLRTSEQHPAWLASVYRAMERRYLRGVQGFVFNSRTTKQAVEELTGEAAVCSVVAPPGGDRFSVRMGSEEIVRRARQGGPLRLTFLGNVIPRKGLHVVLQALALLDGEGWVLQVAGDLRIAKKYAARWRRWTAERNWSDRVRFHGALPEEKIAALLAQSDVLVMPSSYEGFGIAYLEGMGFGLPAIGTTAGAAAELITHGENGFLIPPGDAGALAAHLQLLCRDRARLAAMSLAARARFDAHPTWEQSMAAARAFLTRLSATGGVL